MDKDGENEDIKLKECPRCKTPIRISYRYADIVKVKLAEVEEVKKRLIKAERKFQSFKQDLERKRRRLVTKYPDFARKRAFSEKSEEQAHNANSAYETLESWLQQRKTLAELTTIKNQMEILEQIYKVREKVKTDLLQNTTYGILKPPSACHNVIEQKFLQGATEVDGKLNHLEVELVKFQISSQRLTDITDEVTCVSLLLKIRVVQCEAEKRSIVLGFDNEEWLEIHGKQLNAGTRLSEEDVKAIDAKINEIRKKCGLEGLTPEEKVMIVKAMNFSQGHWYKCLNGHIYAIGECGGAMEKRKCPECDVIIGGTDHTLAQGNEVGVISNYNWFNHTSGQSTGSKIP